MTKPLNPQTHAPAAADSSRQIGTPASSESMNALLSPLSHVAGRIVPIYNMRPTAHQTNEDSTVTVGTWSVPLYPTHGLWRDDNEDDLDSVTGSWFIGPATEQFGTAYCANLAGHIRHPSAVGDNVAEPIPFSADSTWDDLVSTATESESISAGFIARRNARPDPGDILDVHAIAERYADVGLYNLTCRDSESAEMLGAGLVSPIAVQTEEGSAVATSIDAHIITEFQIGDVGTVAAQARFYVGDATTYGITADNADTDPDPSTGYTVIPPVNSFTLRFGAPAPTSGQLLTAPIRDMIHLDRTCYGDRGQVLLSHARTASIVHTEPTAALWSDDSTNWTTAVRGAFFRLPDVLPGSGNITGAGSSTTLALRGGLRARAIMYNAVVKVGVRKVTYAGTYGQTSTFGAWNIATATNATAAFVGVDVADDATAVADHVLLPSGISPGDDYELAIWWRPSSSDGYLRAWCVWEPALSTVSP